MFNLGNHKIVDTLRAVGQDFSDGILYTVDQLSGVSIEIAAESTDFTDKNGTLVRRIFNSKSGTFNSNSAFLHPQLMNVSSGSDIEYASDAKTIVMPEMAVVNAGGTIDVSEANEGTLQVIGIYANGANSKPLIESTSAVWDDEEPTYTVSGGILTVPAAGTDIPTSYVVVYKYNATSGLMMENRADKFPGTHRLTVACSYMDPCYENLRACYVYLPAFQPDPNMTINMNRDTQELPFNGTFSADYCGGNKLLYAIYYPDTSSIVTGISA